MLKINKPHRDGFGFQCFWFEFPSTHAFGSLKGNVAAVHLVIIKLLNYDNARVVVGFPYSIPHIN